jgi:hypothetical protein
VLRYAAAVMFALASALPAASVDFDPVKYGLAEPSGYAIRRDPGLVCTFLRNEVEGAKKVWSCNDARRVTVTWMSGLKEERRGRSRSSLCSTHV